MSGVFRAPPLPRFRGRPAAPPPGRAALPPCRRRAAATATAPDAPASACARRRPPVCPRAPQPAPAAQDFAGRAEPVQATAASADMADSTPSCTLVRTTSWGKAAK